MVPLGGADEPLLHGGDLDAARRLFPGAPEPFIDLSTGINPNPYPLPRFSADLFARLPEPAAATAVAAAAARAYGAHSADQVVPAPGTQILLPLVAGLVRPCRAAIVAPTYAEHARAAAFAGHEVEAVREIDACRGAGLVIVGNPNNPDGRLHARAALLDLAKDLRGRGGLLVVDEAFMDVGPPDASLAADVSCGNVVVLRSFGKFFGLAGIRLGFALAAPAWPRGSVRPSAPGRCPARRLPSAPRRWRTQRGANGRGGGSKRRRSGSMRFSATWVSTSSAAQACSGWRERRKLAHYSVIWAAPAFWCAPSRTTPNWLRFGLPANKREWQRLDDSMASFRDCRKGHRS